MQFADTPSQYFWKNIFFKNPFWVVLNVTATQFNYILRKKKSLPVLTGNFRMIVVKYDNFSQNIASQDTDLIWHRRLQSGRRDPRAWIPDKGRCHSSSWEKQNKGSVFERKTDLRSRKKYLGKRCKKQVSVRQPQEGGVVRMGDQTLMISLEEEIH